MMQPLLLLLLPDEVAPFDEESQPLIKLLPDPYIIDSEPQERLLPLSKGMYSLVGGIPLESQVEDDGEFDEQFDMDEGGINEVDVNLIRV